MRFLRTDAVNIHRLASNPIVRPDMDGRMGRNVNGPSLIRVPDWMEHPLGRYYLYFAHHQGKCIRLAYADDLTGPWRMYEPGVLPFEQAFSADHVASPDVHVVHDRRRIRMYYHASKPDGTQRTHVATSSDGLAFDALPEPLGNGYFRVWRYGGYHYAMSRGGRTFRSLDGLTGFVEGPQVKPDVRHAAVRVDGDTLHVFYSRIGDCPECIRYSTIDMSADWARWTASESAVVLEPEEPWEGADLPLVPSEGGWAPEPMNEVRDPGLYEEDGRWYLLYSVAGEHGLAIGEITEW